MRAPPPLFFSRYKKLAICHEHIHTITITITMEYQRKRNMMNELGQFFRTLDTEGYQIAVGVDDVEGFRARLERDEKFRALCLQSVDQYGYTALWWALQFRCKKIAAELLSRVTDQEYIRASAARSRGGFAGEHERLVEQPLAARERELERVRKQPRRLAWVLPVSRAAAASAVAIAMIWGHKLLR